MAYDFVIGVDVGKYFHHACVLDSQGRQVPPKRINQHEGSLRKLFGQFLADNASVLFPDAAHLASYAGLSPRTNQSGTPIMSNSPNRAGNKN